MSQIEINNKAKEELEAIFNELFINKIDSKLIGRFSELSKKNDEKSNRITAKIETISRRIDENNREIVEKIEDDIQTKLEELKSESKDRNSDLLKVIGENNKGIETIQNRLSEIQNKNLAEILSNALKIIVNQKTGSENFLLKLDSVIKSQTENIISNNSELQSDIINLINENGLNQKKNIQVLDERISDFVELENKNNLNLHKQLDTKFQTAKQLNSVFTRDLDDKIKLLQEENKNQFSKVMNKNNKAFKSLMIINILTLLLLILIHLLNLELFKI